MTESKTVEDNAKKAEVDSSSGFAKSIKPFNRKRNILAAGLFSILFLIVLLIINNFKTDVIDVGEYAVVAGETTLTFNEYNALYEDFPRFSVQEEQFDELINDWIRYKEFMRANGISLSEEDITQADELNYTNVDSDGDESLENNEWRRLLAELTASRTVVEGLSEGSYSGYYIVVSFERYMVPTLSGEPERFGDAGLIEQDRQRAQSALSEALEQAKQDPSQLDSIAEEFRSDELFGRRRSKEFTHNIVNSWRTSIPVPSVQNYIASISEPGFSEIQTITREVEITEGQPEQREVAYYFVYLTEAQPPIILSESNLDSIEVVFNDDVTE